MEDTGTRLWLPPFGLASCVRGAMLRDTRSRSLNAAQRDNYFPAGPLVKLSWYFIGDSMWVSKPGFSPSPPGYGVEPLMLSGPFTLPAHTRSTGPVHMLMLMFPPDAFQALTGIDVPTLVNQVVPARAVLPPDWYLWAMSLHAEVEDDDRLARIEDFLRPRWEALATPRPAAQCYAGWAQGLAM
jgi:hypothetical protein